MSTSAASYGNLVQELYVAYFGRPADYYGLQNFETALAAANAPTTIAGLQAAYSTNAPVRALVDSFGESAESVALYGAGSGTIENFVNAVFENLFNRPAAVAGLEFWTNAINSGQVTMGDAALAIAAGAAQNTTTQGVADALTVANKVAVAGTFTTDLGASATNIVSYAGADAATTARALIAGISSTSVTAGYEATVQTAITAIVEGHINNTYTLTTGVDTLVGAQGNNAFNAVLDNTAGLAAGGQAATLNAFDSITGGTLANALNITDFGLGGSVSIPASASINGITAFNVSTLEGISDNLSNWTELTSVDVKTALGSVNLTVPDTATVNVNDMAGTVTVNGGSTVTAKTNLTNEIVVNGGAGTTAVTLTGGVDNYVTDLNHGTGKANTITTVSLTANGVTGLYSFTTISSDALTTLNVTDEATGVLVYAADGTRTLTVNLDGDGPGYVGVTGGWLEDNSATTLDVNAINHDSNFYIQAVAATTVAFNDTVNLTLSEFFASGAKTISITGAGNFTANFVGVAATVAIDASAAMGGVTATLINTGGQSFVGGAGQDIVYIGATQTAAVTGGGAANNEIVLTNAGNATEADIASVTRFATLGIAGNTSGTFDMSNLTTSYSAFDVQGSGSDVTFENVASGATLSVENGNLYTTTLATTGSNGPTQAVNLNVGTATSVGHVYADITLEDSAEFGIGTVNLASNVSAPDLTNTITVLSDSNLVNLNLSGTGFLDIASTITLKPTVTSFTVSNSLAASSSVSAHIAGLSDAALASLTFSGSAGTDLALLDTSVTSLTLVDNAAGAVSIDTVTDTALTTATFTNSVNTTAGTFTVGSLAEAGLTTLTLNGNVTVTVTGDTVTTGITVAGSTDNADVSFTSAGATASGKTDTITLGNGTDAISLGAGVAGSTQTVTLGNGENDSIITTSLGTVNATVGGATAGTDSITADSAATVHITAGNGTDVISATSALSTTVTVGSGANSITLGTGASGSITIGTHAATVADSIVLGATGATVNTTTAFEKISGLNNAGLDTITFADANASAAAGGVQEVTAADVVASAPSASDTTQLAYWIAAATGAAHSSITSAAGGIVWFQFETNTYIVETAAADSGTLQAGDTVVELTGTGYTFAKATAATGTLHLLG